jgi:hypothetical protein
MEEVTADQDRVMAESATIALLDHPRLTESLLDGVERAMSGNWSAAARRLDERRLQLPLEANPANLALWDRAVSSGSRRLHLWLLERSGVPDGALESLADHGATRAVRNRASQALRSRSGT